MSNSVIPQIFLTSVENLLAYSGLFSNARRGERLDIICVAMCLLCAEIGNVLIKFQQLWFLLTFHTHTQKHKTRCMSLATNSFVLVCQRETHTAKLTGFAFLCCCKSNFVHCQSQSMRGEAGSGHRGIVSTILCACVYAGYLDPQGQLSSSVKICECSSLTSQAWNSVSTLHTPLRYDI